MHTTLSSTPNALNSPRVVGQCGGTIQHFACKRRVLGLVKGDWDEPTTRGKEYYEYLRLAERACFILRMRLSPLAEDKVKDIDYNDPKRAYNDLKQEFEPDTAANCLDKFLNALQGNEESTVRYGGRVCGLLREWSELWPASYSLLKLKEELWMHVVLVVLAPASSTSGMVMLVQRSCHSGTHTRLQ